MSRIVMKAMKAPTNFFNSPFCLRGFPHVSINCLNSINSLCSYFNFIVYLAHHLIMVNYSINKLNILYMINILYLWYLLKLYINSFYRHLTNCSLFWCGDVRYPNFFDSPINIFNLNYFLKQFTYLSIYNSFSNIRCFT